MSALLARQEPLRLLACRDSIGDSTFDFPSATVASGLSWSEEQWFVDVQHKSNLQRVDVNDSRYRRVIVRQLMAASTDDRVMSELRRVLSHVVVLAVEQRLCKVDAAFAAGLAVVPGIVDGLQLNPSSQCMLNALNEALKVLEKSRGSLKRSMLAACSAFIAADRHVEVGELERLRVSSDALGCPVPRIIQTT